MAVYHSSVKIRPWRLQKKVIIRMNNAVAICLPFSCTLDCFPTILRFLYTPSSAQAFPLQLICMHRPWLPMQSALKTLHILKRAHMQSSGKFEGAATFNNGWRGQLNQRDFKIKVEKAKNGQASHNWWLKHNVPLPAFILSYSCPMAAGEVDGTWKRYPPDILTQSRLCNLPFDVGDYHRRFRPMLHRKHTGRDL